MKIIFSVPIYDIENAIEVCKNVLKYVEHGYIVLHNNENSSFENKDLLDRIKQEIKQYQRIFVNSQRLRMDTPHQQSPNALWEILLSNLKYLFEITHLIGEWDYVINMMSNERLVRYGLDEYLQISDYDAGYTAIPLWGFGDGNTQITPEKRLHWGENLAVWKYIVPYINDFYYGQVDGAFLSKKICEYLIKIPNNDYHGLDITASVEKLLPTFIHDFTTKDKIGKSITYIDWHNELKITTGIIEDIRYSNKKEYSGIYSVKRVNMVDIELRNYIENMDPL